MRKKYKGEYKVMKNKFVKRIISLVLMLVMLVSVMAISAVPASAASEVEYKIAASTGGGDTKSVDIMKVKITGANGSTGWHSIAAFGALPGKAERSFDDIDVGKIESITVKNIGVDGWFPKKFVITTPSGEVTIYGGKWVDDGNEVTFSTTDYAVYFTIITDSSMFSGTDADVYMKLYDNKGKASHKIDLSSIHPEINSFELGDVFSYCVSLPSDFGKLSKAELIIEPVGLDDNIFNLGSDWKVERIKFEVKSGPYKGNNFDNILHQWCEFDKPIKIDLHQCFYL